MSAVHVRKYDEACWVALTVPAAILLDILVIFRRPEAHTAPDEGMALVWVHGGKVNISPSFNLAAIDGMGHLVLVRSNAILVIERTDLIVAESEKRLWRT